MALQIRETFQNGMYRPVFGERPFALKAHWATRFHYDLRLVWGLVSFSWVLPHGVRWRVGDVCTAIEVEDHKESNLLFEGVHRTGTVMTWDCGSWEPRVKASDVLHALDRGLLHFTLRGGRLEGVFTLRRTNGLRSGSHPSWTLRKDAELFGASSSWRTGPSGTLRSICTGRTMEQIERDWNKRGPKQPDLFD